MRGNGAARRLGEAAGDREAVEVELVAQVVGRGAPAFAELSKTPFASAWLTGTRRLAVEAALEVATRGEPVSPELLEVEVKRVAGPARAAEVRVAAESAVEAFGGEVPVGRLPRLVDELAELRDAEEAVGVDVSKAFSALSVGAALGVEEERLERPAPRIATGWPRLDTALGGGLEIPSLVVLGAPPKAAKSTWAQIVAVRHVEAGGVAYVLDLENGPRRFLRRILCRRAQLGPTAVARALKDARAAAFASRDELQRWRAAKDWLAEVLAPGLFVEHVPPVDFAARVAQARALAGDRPLLVVVDSLQKLPGDPREDRRTVVDRWVRLFERLRFDHDAVILVVSEVRRGRDGYAAREDAFKESGGVEYGADLAMTLNRPAADEGEDAPATLRVELARDCETDPRGEVASYAAVHPHYGLEEQDPVERRGAANRGPRATRLEAAQDFLRRVLAAGPVRVEDLERQAQGEGISRATLNRARGDVGAVGCTLELRRAWRLP